MGEHISQWRGRLNWRVGLEVRAAMTQQRFRYRPLGSDRDQRPPPLRPGLAGTTTHGGRGFPRLEGDQLPH